MKKTGERLVTLDVARGITIMGMIIVNNPGSLNNIYSQLSHSPWHGLRFPDLGVPVFLVIVGMALAYALGKRVDNGVPKSKIYKKVIVRTVIIFVLGVLFGAFPFFTLNPLEFVDAGSFRLVGVLQRIALGYLCASIIFLECRKPAYIATIAVVLLTSYQLLLTQMPVPEFIFGEEAAGYHTVLAYFDAQSTSGYTDLQGVQVLMFAEIISAAALVLSGTLAGMLLRSTTISLKKKCVLIGVAGVLLLTAGIICSYFWPINKKLLTASFVFTASGITFTLFSVAYWIIEIRSIKKWTVPFIVFGKNALPVFAGSVMASKLIQRIIFPEGLGSGSIRNIIYYQLLRPVASPYVASILYAVLFMLFWLGVMWILYKRRVFVRV